MIDFLKNPYKYVQGVGNNQSITAKLSEILKKESKRDVVPENYFYLTDLVNPASAYWSRSVSSEVSNSSETLRKLVLGKRIESLASIWFKKLPDFVSEQGKLDGAFVGVPGVVGKLDFLIGESIVELKSKQSLPESESDVLGRYLHDVEQLAFYSVLSPSEPKENYLVFINQSRPYKFKAFKLVVGDFGKVKSVMLRRIKGLKKAVEDKDCKVLGRCRYFDRGCKFQDNRICDCESLASVPDTIISAVELKYDPGMTEVFQSEIEKSAFSGNLYLISDLISPRKKIMRYKLKKSEETPAYAKSDYDAYVSFLESLVRGLPYRVSREQRAEVGKKVFDDRLMIGQKWLCLPCSGVPDGRLVPYTVKYGSASNREYALRPNEFHVKQLGLICASYGVTSGLIFVIYPHLSDLIQTFEVSFKSDLKEIQPQIKDVLDRLDKAMETGDFSALHPCPEFFKCGCCGKKDSQRSLRF